MSDVQHSVAYMLTFPMYTELDSGDLIEYGVSDMCGNTWMWAMFRACVTWLLRSWSSLMMVSFYGLIGIHHLLSNASYCWVFDPFE